MSDTCYFDVNFEVRKINPFCCGAFGVLIFRMKICLKFMLQIGADSLPVGYSKQSRFQMGGFSEREICGFGFKEWYCQCAWRHGFSFCYDASVLFQSADAALKT